MNQFKKDMLVVTYIGTFHEFNKKVYPVHDVVSDDFVSVNFDGRVKLVNSCDIRPATEEEIVKMQRDDSLSWLDYHIKHSVEVEQQPDIIDLPFTAGLGAEGTYGMSDEQLAKHQQDCLGRHDRMCRNLIIIALLLVAAIAGMNWWVA